MRPLCCYFSRLTFCALSASAGDSRYGSIVGKAIEKMGCVVPFFCRSHPAFGSRANDPKISTLPIWQANVKCAHVSVIANRRFQLTSSGTTAYEISMLEMSRKRSFTHRDCMWIFWISRWKMTNNYLPFPCMGRTSIDYENYQGAQEDCPRQNSWYVSFLSRLVFHFSPLLSHDLILPSTAQTSRSVRNSPFSAPSSQRIWLYRDNHYFR